MTRKEFQYSCAGALSNFSLVMIWIIGFLIIWGFELLSLEANDYCLSDSWMLDYLLTTGIFIGLGFLANRMEDKKDEKVQDVKEK